MSKKSLTYKRVFILSLFLLIFAFFYSNFININTDKSNVIVTDDWEMLYCMPSSDYMSFTDIEYDGDEGIFNYTDTLTNLLKSGLPMMYSDSSKNYIIKYHKGYFWNIRPISVNVSSDKSNVILNLYERCAISGGICGDELVGGESGAYYSQLFIIPTDAKVGAEIDYDMVTDVGKSSKFKDETQMIGLLIIAVLIVSIVFASILVFIVWLLYKTDLKDICTRIINNFSFI